MVGGDGEERVREHVEEADRQQGGDHRVLESHRGSRVCGADEQRGNTADAGGDDGPGRLRARREIEAEEEDPKPERRERRETDRRPVCCSPFRIGLARDQHHSDDPPDRPDDLDRRGLLSPGEAGDHRHQHAQGTDRRHNAHRSERHRPVEGG